MATIEIGGKRYSFDEAAPIDISIPLRFNGPQPNAFGVDAASVKPLGDTRTSSSVNFEQYTFTPHCNGTHTECVGHITNERISVRECLRDTLVAATLVTVRPVSANGELAITADLLRGTPAGDALIVRTLPNDDLKLSAVYDADNIPPYFTEDAMTYIVERSVKHLLVDMPSIDRLFDDGKLINHRIFWNVEQGSFETGSKTRVNSTITELIYVSERVKDGEYLLNLQIAPFESDAAPSRPVLFERVLESGL